MKRYQLHVTQEGDLRIVGHLYKGRRVGDRVISDVIEGYSCRSVFFTDGTHRNFRYARRVNT
ncbi:hypothetical protein [Streptomyces sp. NPDC006355]|uniref:hypothetical protein n=1 Tax=Streptomyces sp. NPDC006355 TaxID=3156758 RepID=UPI0033AEBA6F